MESSSKSKASKHKFSDEIYSKEIVTKFEGFLTFKQGAEFLQTWIKLKKNKASGLCSDLPMIIERALLVRSKSS